MTSITNTPEEEEEEMAVSTTLNNFQKTSVSRNDYLNYPSPLFFIQIVPLFSLQVGNCVINLPWLADKSFFANKPQLAMTIEKGYKIKRWNCSLSNSWSLRYFSCLFCSFYIGIVTRKRSSFTKFLLNFESTRQFIFSHFFLNESQCRKWNQRKYFHNLQKHWKNKIEQISWRGQSNG